jgi:uncharacterized tellurite resistance protein B-like protein
MNLLELFDSRDKKRRLSHMRNLIALACADGSIEESELNLIFKMGARSGLTTSELKRIMERPDSISFYPPASDREQVEQLYDMVLVMMVNGELHENEIAFCKITALRLGFNARIIDKMIKVTIDLIAKGIAAEIALSRLMDLDLD